MDPHKAASIAMREVAGAVMATSLVLMAVFVPWRSFRAPPGILFRQFALTIAFSIALSAFNALTLTPALSAILLRPRRMARRTGSSAGSTKLIDGMTAGYGGALRFFLRSG